VATRNRIGIRLEDKNDWERRAPLVPSDVAALGERGVEIEVERSARRVFPDSEYADAGAALVDDVRPCDLVLGIKEMPVDFFRENGAYMFFSHTIKGQSFNMPMLARLVRRRCTLIDHELVADGSGRRLIFFGRFAGLAGMLDTLWTLGRRLEALGHRTPFLELEPTHRYDDLDKAKEAVASVGRRIGREGVPAALAPIVFGFAGYGHVSQGAQELFDLVPHVEVAPGELGAFVGEQRTLTDRLAKVVFKEEHLVERIDPQQPFELQEYYDHPERYRSVFESELRRLTVLVNGIFWTEKYPKLADAKQLRALFRGPEPPKLLVVGDITCDVDGSLACTVRDTDAGDPVFLYDPDTREARSGFEGPGLAVMAVGNLPAELPREASLVFSGTLAPFLPDVARADLAGGLTEAGLPEPIERAVVLWHGEFTPRFEYMRDFLR
jgi:alpha-aminoadipic semialdehyde synthase